MKKSNLLNILFDRGYVQDCTDIEGLDKLLSEAEAEGRSIPIYIGFDMTAKSLHVGGLTQIMILRHIQKAGHKPVVLLGGGTTLIGDPSGRDETRQLLTDAIIAENTLSISKVFAKYLHFGYNHNNDAITVNNAEWLKELPLVDFLRDIGRYFSVNKMLSFESVKRRLEREQNLSFLEFNYMIFQAYDFTVLNKNHGVRVQIGGSDQWGNIVNGTELNRRLGGEELFGLTTPLLTTASGVKMGKSLSGAVWLDESMLSPYDFWQFWRNTEDADVIKFLKLFTELPLPEIEALSKLEGAEINKAKIILANEVTKLAHGADAAKQAHETAVKVFEQGAHGGSLPVYEVEKAALEAGIMIVQLLADSGLADTRGAAKRLIQGGGAKVNGERVDESFIANLSHLNDEGVIKLSSGKKNHILVKVKN